MRTVDIIVMGKTGAGKSTMINAVIGQELAPTGVGHAVTRKNEVYKKEIALPIYGRNGALRGRLDYTLNMYDTVGLEIDNSITEQTLSEIRRHIEKSREKRTSEDIHLVWFCVNNRSNRFESYELELIKKLSIDYEIPFIVVLTQCFSDEESELEEQIRKSLTEVARKRVLAKDFSTRGGVIPAYGIDELLHMSVTDYKALKVKILQKKLWELDETRKARIKQIENKGNSIVSDYASAATKIGFVPGGCILIVHGMCVKMIADLNKLAGIKASSSFASEIFADVMLGVVATPFMMVPLLSVAVAQAYINQVGGEYLKALLQVIHLSSDRELADNQYVKERLKTELAKLRK